MNADVTILPTSNSQASEWLLWYQALKSQFGKQVAAQTWLRCWEKRGNHSQNTSTELRAALAKDGINIDKSILDSAVDTGESILGGIGSFLNVGKYAVYGIAFVAIGGFAMVVFNLAKSPAKAVCTIAKTAI